MIGLYIERSQLDRIEQATAARAQAESSANGGTVTRYVTPEVIASTATQYPSCKCEELGLVAGMPVAGLIELESGCTGTAQKIGVAAGHRGGWVCERLVKVRRMYGL